MPVGVCGPLDLMNAVMDGFGDLFRCFNMKRAAMLSVATLPQVIINVKLNDLYIWVINIFEFPTTLIFQTPFVRRPIAV